ncbi:hypothetical protein FB639_004192 [Coemansia asiatica]|nr:hypothetical protein FB639_004192 [Coemansia asiatica]
MLLAQGFKVLHIDEFKTLTWCPYCEEGKLEKFLHVKNPRPHQQIKWPVIMSYAVLRCKNVNCEGWVKNAMTGESCPRILNHDLAACLNFRHIVTGLWEHGKVPECFMHLQRTVDADEVAPDNGSRESPDNEPPAQRRRIE